MITAAMIVIAIVIFITVIVLNISICKRRINRWDSNSTLLFAFSVSQVGNGRKMKLWKQKGGYSDMESRIVIGYQNQCLVEIIVIVTSIFVFVGYLTNR
jgi:hypothetical protein